MNAEMIEGATDSTVKKYRPDTAGVEQEIMAPHQTWLQGGWADVAEDYAHEVVRGVVRGT